MKDEAFLVYGNEAKVSRFYQNPRCNRNRKYTFTMFCNNLIALGYANERSCVRKR